MGLLGKNLVSRVPIMVVEGNHEIEKQAGNKTFVAYSSRFAFPSEESGSSSTFYYSFNAGGIHFVMLGAYINYNRTADQYKWLERDLASVDRSITPWLVAAWHPPWYSTYKAHYREAECMRVEVEDLLYSYGVDIVFNGHGVTLPRIAVRGGSHHTKSPPTVRPHNSDHRCLVHAKKQSADILPDRGRDPPSNRDYHSTSSAPL